MTTTIDTLATSLRRVAPTSDGPTDARVLENFVAQLVAAFRAQLMALPTSAASRYERRASDDLHVPRPTTAREHSGRTLPKVIGGGGEGARASRTDGAGRRPGELDLAAILAHQLARACGGRDAEDRGAIGRCDSTPPSDCEATPPSDCGATPPSDCEATPPSDCEATPPSGCGETPPGDGGETPPTDGEAPPEPARKKVFIVGDLVKFGRSDGTVRSGLEQLLAASEGKKQKRAVAQGTLSAEDAQKLRALLASKDPQVEQVLKSKVPNKKSLVIDEDGRLVTTLRTKDEVMANASLRVGDHKNNRIDRSAGGELSVGDTTYDVAGTELHSPVKVTLDGTDAALDGAHGFRIDLNGFDERGGEAKTSGGLRSNEAWLVRDRAGDGIVKRGVVDGDDVYGDHNGLRKDGYEDLARDFADEVKTDPRTGARYIDLTAPGSRAAKELQLLDARGRLRPASEVLTRIGVDGRSVDERDGKGNVITARSEVTYRDGTTAQSADQWYRTQAA